MVHPASDRVPRARPYSGTTQQRPLSFAYVAITRSGRPSQATSTRQRFSYSAQACQSLTCSPTTTTRQRLTPITSCRFRLFPFRSPLLGESRLISFPLATEMFHFARLPAYDYEFIVSSKLFKLSGFPIRISPDQSPLAAPRGFSQPATSFVDAYRLGIHHVLFSTSIPNFAYYKFGKTDFSAFQLHKIIGQSYRERHDFLSTRLHLLLISSSVVKDLPAGENVPQWADR